METSRSEPLPGELTERRRLAALTKPQLIDEVISLQKLVNGADHTDLIGQACEAFGGLTSAEWADAAEWEHQEVREGVGRVWAVFEAAHAKELDTSPERVKNGPDSLHDAAQTTVQLMARRGGKAQALIDSMLAQANDQGIRVEVVYPQTAALNTKEEAHD